MASPKVIVPLRARTWAELEPKLDQLTAEVDIVEIWIDQLFMEFLRNPILLPTVAQKMKALKSALDIEVLAVCKSPAEQGQFGGTPAQRIELLQAFLQLGGDLIDLDIQHNHTDLLRPLDKDRLWLSLHGFVGVPDNLEHLVRDMKLRQPAVYKFAVTPRDEAELDTFIEFAQNFSQDHNAIFTTMGELGAEGRERLKDITWGAFYALNENERTATGQPVITSL